MAAATNAAAPPIDRTAQTGRPPHVAVRHAERTQRSQIRPFLAALACHRLADEHRRGEGGDRPEGHGAAGLVADRLADRFDLVVPDRGTDVHLPSGERPLHRGRGRLAVAVPGLDGDTPEPAGVGERLGQPRTADDLGSSTSSVKVRELAARSSTPRTTPTTRTLRRRPVQAIAVLRQRADLVRCPEREDELVTDGHTGLLDEPLVDHHLVRRRGDEPPAGDDDLIAVEAGDALVAHD